MRYTHMIMTTAMNALLSTSMRSSMPATSTDPPPGNPANTVDNNIISPTWGASVPYGSNFMIEWKATTSGSISVFYRIILPAQVITEPVGPCQNIINVPGKQMSCPWSVFPSSLPSSSNQGFDIMLVWNSSTSGEQISPQFGVFNATSPTASTNLTASSTSTQSGVSSTPAISNPPDATVLAEHSLFERIGLGVGLGIGIPFLALLLVACLFLRRRRSKDNAGDDTELSQRSIDLPPYNSSRLAKASMQPHASDLDTPELLANYRNAEHFGFKPTTPTNK